MPARESPMRIYNRRAAPEAQRVGDTAIRLELWMLQMPLRMRLELVRDRENLVVVVQIAREHRADRLWVVHHLLHGATPCGVVIALDRMERGNGELSAVQEVRRDHAMVVVAVATLDDLLGFLQHSPELRQNMAAVTQYRATYGAKSHE